MHRRDYLTAKLRLPVPITKIILNILSKLLSWWCGIYFSVTWICRCAVSVCVCADQSASAECSHKHRVWIMRQNLQNVIAEFIRSLLFFFHWYVGFHEPNFKCHCFSVSVPFPVRWYLFRNACSCYFLPDGLTFVTYILKLLPSRVLSHFTPPVCIHHKCLPSLISATRVVNPSGSHLLCFFTHLPLQFQSVLLLACLDLFVCQHLDWYPGLDARRTVFLSPGYTLRSAYLPHRSIAWFWSKPLFLVWALIISKKCTHTHVSVPNWPTTGYHF